MPTPGKTHVEIECSNTWKRWGLPVRVFASLCLGYHVLAMFVSPWAVPPTSELAVSLQRYVAHYQTLLYLNHGYRFFAPDPGPSSIVGFSIVQADGKMIQGLFPDRHAINRQYPRLNYHRWFMWSETLGRMSGQWLPRAEYDQYLEMEQASVQQLRDQGLELEASRLASQLELDRREWEELEAERQEILTPVARVLLERLDGVEIQLTLNRRMIPSLLEARTGMRPSDPRLMEPERAFELGRWRWDESSGELKLSEPSPMLELDTRSGEALPTRDEATTHE